jgi:muramoyltetrapeptide carboxypeptidase
MIHTILPPFLKPGDAVGITCPAGYVSFERIAYAVDVLQRWGFRVVIGRTVGSGEFYFSGHDGERLTDLQAMLDDPDIKAILMGRGGYGTSRIIDAIDFNAFQQHPKWICGFSDITVLHSHIHRNYGIATLHSPMCGAFTPESENGYYVQSLRKALTGQSLSYDFPGSPAGRAGLAEGAVAGGNLAILAHLTGSASQVDTNGKILFIEDIGEHYYHVDRLLLNLKRSGQLSGLKGLLVGQFTDMEDTDRPFGQTLEEIVMDKVADYDYPVAFNFPCGHDTENVTLPLGIVARLEAGAKGGRLAVLRGDPV